MCLVSKEVHEIIGPRTYSYWYLVPGTRSYVLDLWYQVGVNPQCSGPPQKLHGWSSTASL